MQPRMLTPALTLPGAMDSLLALSKSLENCGVPRTTIELMNMRASQINGCSVCLALSALVMAIGVINLWNRLNAATRQVTGEWISRYT